APIFSLQSTQLGRGIVGGRLMRIDDLAETSAGAAVSILAGEPPSHVEIPDQLPGPPVYDARELRRWKIDERFLPPGSVVHFREPGGLRDGIPAPAVRRRIPLGARHGYAALRIRRLVSRVYRKLCRRHRTPACGVDAVESQPSAHGSAGTGARLDRTRAA